jgi:micrococcal nuclease
MYHYKAKAERVIDGDTLDVNIDLGFKITTVQRIRLARVNTPETYNVKKDTEEYQKGMTAKQFVEQRLAANNNQLLIETEKVTEKYGRYIGTVWFPDSAVSLNDELVEKGLATYVEY